MRNDRPTNTPDGPTFIERYRRPFDISWLKDHPKFAGFMEHPVDGGFEASTFQVNVPYRENILKVIERDEIISFAPYMGTLLNHHGSDGPGRIAVLRIAFKYKPGYFER